MADEWITIGSDVPAYWRNLTTQEQTANPTATRRFRIPNASTIISQLDSYPLRIEEPASSGTFYDSVSKSVSGSELTVFGAPTV